MQKSDFKQIMEGITVSLPESRRHALIAFADYLIESEKSEEIFKMRMGSSAYREWTSSENDIYDELFKNEVKER